MKFERWLEDVYGMCAGNSDTYYTSEAAWSGCKHEILKVIKNTKAPKVPGMEGLGGCSWEDMDAETFRGILIEKIKKL